MIYSLAHAIIILIHGTWGTDAEWHQSGGHFYEMLNMQAEKQHALVVPFSWTGSNSNDARDKAAHALLQLIKSYPTDTKIYIVAHSHGGNVATLTSQLMAKHALGHRIDSLYLLGTPAARHYAPNMDVINYVYNLISFQDYIQPIIGIFDRGQPQHPRIANMSITINGQEPGHTDMHHYSVALWLISLDKCMHEKHTNGFERFEYGVPGIVHFYNHQEPEYVVDLEWDKRIDRDKQIQERIVASILRSKVNLAHPLAQQNDLESTLL